MNAKSALAIAAAAIVFGSSSLALAGNAGASLGDCYNHVISACNQTAHPVPCSNSGMDACDDLHSGNAAIDPGALKGFKAAGPRRSTLLLPAVQAAR